MWLSGAFSVVHWPFLFSSRSIGSRSALKLKALLMPLQLNMSRRTLVFFTALAAWCSWHLWFNVQAACCLAVFTLAFGVTGYSLPWDQIGFWALQIVSALPGAVDDFAPGAGLSIVLGIRGGLSVGQVSLSRTCTAHTLALPAGVPMVSLFHFLLIRKQGVSGPL